MCSLEKRGRVYLLTFTGDGEHRLNPSFIGSLRSALARVRSAAAGGGGVALVTAAEGKFFSNGLDLDWVRADPAVRLPALSAVFRGAIADLLSLPLPTVAAVTGHAAAAGFGLALAHDYVVMRGDRGFLYLSEVDAGLPIAKFFMALLREKIGDRKALRDAVMRGTKFTATEAARRGIVVDRVTATAAESVEEAVRMAEELAARGWEGMIYATIRRASLPETCKEVGLEEINEEEMKKAFAAKL